MDELRHLGPERLAEAAADDPTRHLEAAEREHLASCPSCAASVDSLAAVLNEARAADTFPVQAPRAGLWSDIAVAISREDRRAADDLRPQPVSVAGAARPSRWVVAAVAAAAGLLVGIGGTAAVLGRWQAADRTDVLTRTSLAPLPGESGDGSITLTRIDGQLQVRIQAQLGAVPTRDFYEVWLINGDGRRMYALGVLPASGHADFWVPVGLDPRSDDYRIVDVSLEADNGDPTHSRHSLLRGQLPL